MATHTNHWEVECCSVILILSSCGITQIVTQKGVQVIKSRISN